MPHKVEISDKTYEDLKEFCSLNNLKIGQFADKLIRDGLMIEMYGDVPFTNYRVNLPREELVALVKECESNSVPIKEWTGETSPAAQVVKDVIKDFEKLADESEARQREKSSKTEEALKESGVPDKVANKITKLEALKELEEPVFLNPYINSASTVEIEKFCKKLTEDTLKEIGIPDKVANKITKRRLK